MAIDHITVTGAREHNLKGINVSIPKNKLVVFTGLSGSGKSSLAFDTLYAEGQRRYVESLSSYARQFLGMMSKPDVDQIEGLSPAISIDQKTTSHNPRSTVGTITEIYDYLRLLFARVGHPHCPECGQEVSTQSIDQIVTQVMDRIGQRFDAGVIRLMVLSPVVRGRKGEFAGLFGSLVKQGYARARVDGRLYDLNSDLTLIKTNKHTIEVVLDRITTSLKQLKNEQERRQLRTRLAQSIEQALQLADGLVVISFINDHAFDFPQDPSDVSDVLFSEKLACSHCGISISEVEPRLFSFNSPQGACPVCNGLGSRLKIDEQKIIAGSLTLSEGAIVPFAKVLSSDSWWSRLVQAVVADQDYDFRKTGWEEFDGPTKQLLLHGSDRVYTVTGANRFGKATSIEETFEGFVTNLERRYHQSESDFVRREISQYMQQEKCPSCQGARLKPEALSIRVGGSTIAEVTQLPINQALDWSQRLSDRQLLNPKEITIAASILREITARLKFLVSVGLSYLTLHRQAASLAGGEAQRIRLASQIGTGLTGVLYILDEPTIGLHQRDNDRLIETLESLRDKGNTVIVVEHDRDVILAADHVIDFGPAAGEQGGEVVATGTPAQVQNNTTSLTGKFLKRSREVSRTKTATGRRIVSDDDDRAVSIDQRPQLRVSGASRHNLKSIEVEFPLRTLTGITGISGSGKSSLLHDTLYYNLAQQLGYTIDQKPGEVERLSIPDEVKKVALIDQSPIGKTPRSNPATYTKVFDYIRQVFANTQEARVRGYRAGRFSFNVKGGRCEACRGDGQLKIEMQFLADVYVTCDVCHGERYNEETLQVTYRGATIGQVLGMSVDQAYQFFSNHSTLRAKLKTLREVGLGYIKLGQPAPTLSGGEAQRVKLAKELTGRSYHHVVYLLDEPTTGLHFADVQKLLNVLHQLVANNNTVVIIEHNLDVIKNVDWVIDLGPEGGEQGGEVVAVGTPAQLASHSRSYTGHYLKQELAAMKAGNSKR
ncbi:MAG: excinuclease ABC subunit UvrA [Candidatus Pacebacteria bacterium CG10_big_fil_rev_8_21_14_0_10_56_10]|nr:MAG: excinuclease ABC subunit UvrA [Candidatus Pacebacteria bacterium CG10_big_fil_rev_8_21_14_0_10_56_10]